MVTPVTEANFDAFVGQGVVLLDAWAAWCGPCRAFAPVFDAAAVRHPDVSFGKIDTEAQPELAAAFKIRSIPTLIVLRDGIVLAQQAGMVSGGALDSIIAQVQALDMDEVRRSVEEQSKQDQPAATGTGGA